MSAPARLALRRSLGGVVLAVVLVTLMIAVASWGILRARGPEWARVALMALLAGSYVALVAIAVQGRRAYLSEAGVHQPRLFGRETFIAWPDVTRVELFRGVSLHVHAADRRRVVLALYTFGEPDRVFELVRERTKQVTLR